MTRKDGSIFVSVPSYRDELCATTLHSMFQMAHNPWLVFAGVCQQNSSLDPECVDESLHQNIRIIRIDHREARGPCYARYLCSTLYGGEEFYLQIDSHTQFVPGWDSILKSMIAQLPPRSVLSHYPQPFDPQDPDSAGRRGTVPSNCRSEESAEGVPAFRAVELPERPEPRPTNGIAGGMLFAPGEALLETPLDPSLDFLFTGEEVLYGARLYTRGWDIYSPSRNVMYHYYQREDSPKFWDEPSIRQRRKQLHEDPTEKVKRVLGLGDSVPILGKYGLGWSRPVSRYLEGLNSC